MQLADLPTPALALDLARVTNNCRRMSERAAQLGVRLRPHMKTAKCAEVARLATSSSTASGITVSTVAEAAYFAAHGFKDITYAVSIAVQKLPALSDLQRRAGANIKLLVDSVSACRALIQGAAAAQDTFDILIEIDCGGGRGGVDCNDRTLLVIADLIADTKHLSLAGVLTHAGHAYRAPDRQTIARIAETERLCAVTAASALRGDGHAISTVSIGSTPTSIVADNLAGITEIRPGVYTLFDLDQWALGICGLEDIAVSVFATVIGHNPRSKSVLIDAGALALSKDLSAHKHVGAIGYGLVSLAAGCASLPGVCVSDVHQEHGFITSTGSFDELCSLLPIGDCVRILPNHICMTAASYDRYYVVSGDDRVVAEWPKLCSGRWNDATPSTRESH